MRIAHVQHPYLPDHGYQENYLPAHQSEIGHEVRVFSSTSIPRKFREAMGSTSFPAGRYVYNGVDVIRMKSLFEIREIEDLALKGLGSQLAEFDPDIVHTHGLVSPRTIQSLLFTSHHGARLFVDVHIDNGNFNLDSYTKRILFALYNIGFLPILARESAGFLSVNAYAQQFLEERRTISDRLIHFLPLGVSRDEFTYDPQSGNAVRERLGVNEETFLIIFAGNIEPTKDIKTLIKAISQLSVDFTLLLLGSVDPSYKKEIQQLARFLKIASNIRFHGSVPHSELPSFLNSADFGVWPGKLGITCVEAIGCGLPLIVPNDPAMKYLVSADNGQTFSQGDVDSLASSMIRYINEPDLLDSHQKNAIQFAESELYWDRIAEKSIKIYSNEFNS